MVLNTIRPTALLFIIVSTIVWMMACDSVAPEDNRFDSESELSTEGDNNYSEEGTQGDDTDQESEFEEASGEDSEVDYTDDSPEENSVEDGEADDLDLSTDEDLDEDGDPDDSDLSQDDNEDPPLVKFENVVDKQVFTDRIQNITVFASDDDGIEKVELYINSNLVRDEKVPPYEWRPVTDDILNTMENGTYRLKAVAYDTTGYSAEVSIDITLDIEDDNDSNTTGGGSGGSGGCTLDTPVAGLPNYDFTMHNVLTKRMERKDFCKADKWYSEWLDNGKPVQEFSLHQGDDMSEHVPGGRKHARTEFEDGLWATKGQGKWMEWEGRMLINKKPENTITIGQIFGPNGPDARVEIHRSGELKVGSLKGGGSSVQLTGENHIGRSFKIKMRTNGARLEVYFNDQKKVDCPTDGANGQKWHFRWGVYSNDVPQESTPLRNTVTELKVTN